MDDTTMEYDGRKITKPEALGISIRKSDRRFAVGRITNIGIQWGTKQREREKNGLLADADRGWMAIDHGIRKISELGYEPEVCFLAGRELVESNDGYIANFGWGLLAQPRLVDYMVADGAKGNEILTYAENFIPDDGFLPSVSDRDPSLYNLTWGVETVARLHKKAFELGAEDLARRSSEFVLTLSAKQKNLLRQSVNATDLVGTELEIRNLLIDN